MSISVRKEERDDTTHVELREIRFRDCGNWEMDLRVDFGAGTKRNLAPYYDVRVTRDDTAAEAKAREAAFLEELQGKKEAKENARDEGDLAKIRPLAQDGKSASTIETKTGIRRSRVVRLLEKYGAGQPEPVGSDQPY